MRTPPLQFGAINYHTDLPFAEKSGQQTDGRIPRVKVKNNQTEEVMIIEQKQWLNSPTQALLHGDIEGSEANSRWYFDMEEDGTIPTLDLVG